jgi:hypothetical protein
MTNWTFKDSTSLNEAPADDAVEEPEKKTDTIVYGKV